MFGSEDFSVYAMDSRLVGHDNPSGRYPAPVVPILAIGDRLAVVFAGDESRDPTPLDGDVRFVVHGLPLQSDLKTFSPDTHRLFAFTVDRVVMYEIADEPRFFQEVLRDSTFSSENPFLRLALAKATRQLDVIRQELLVCLSHFDSTPALRDSWYRAQRDELLAAQPPYLAAVPEDWRVLHSPSLRDEKAANKTISQPSPPGISRRIVGDIVILDLRGNMTFGGDQQLYRTVRELISAGFTKIILNLEDVAYIDSAGLGELLSTYAALNKLGGTVKLLNVSKRVQDLFVLTNLFKSFGLDAYSSETEAIRSFMTS